MRNTALLIIDMQNDYFDGGKNPLVGSFKAVGKAKEILSLFRMNDLKIIHIRHITKRLNVDFFMPDTKGSEIHDAVKPHNNEKVIIKHSPNSFIDTELQDYLNDNEIGELVVCGMMTHICVDSTVRAAKDFGFNTTVISDACATKKLIFNEIQLDANVVNNVFLSAFKGYYAHVVNAQEYISGLENLSKTK